MFDMFNDEEDEVSTKEIKSKSEIKFTDQLTV